MFTGLIEEVGTVEHLQPIDGGVRIRIGAKHVLSDLKIGDSICVSGVCLTVIAKSSAAFAVEAVGETLEKTSLGELAEGRKINLERSLAANGRFGGHIVQGHVNATGRIHEWFRRGENWYLSIEIPKNLLRYVILEGSIAIEGISLTVAALSGNQVGINIIPHTAAVTNLQDKRPGEPVNIEVDVMAKYVENLLSKQVFSNQE